MSCPAWVSERTLVLAVSYSGNTAETLACVERALPAQLPAGLLRGIGRPPCRRRGTPRAAAHRRACGDLQPRASIGYLSMPIGAASRPPAWRRASTSRSPKPSRSSPSCAPSLPPTSPTTTTRPRPSPAGCAAACPSCTARVSRRPPRGAGEQASTGTARRLLQRTAARPRADDSRWTRPRRGGARRACDARRSRRRRAPAPPHGLHRDLGQAELRCVSLVTSAVPIEKACPTAGFMSPAPPGIRNPLRSHGATARGPSRSRRAPGPRSRPRERARGRVRS